MRDARDSTVDTYVMNGCEGYDDGNGAADIVDVRPDNGEIRETDIHSDVSNRGHTDKLNHS